MYQHHRNKITESRSHKYLLYQDDRQLRYRDFLTLLQENYEFRTFFIELLSDVSFSAYHWETPPVTSETLGQPFEFVVTNSPGINVPPAPGAFRPYFDTLSDVVVFDNLGGDAKLIAPTPFNQEQELNYSHIGVFTNKAPLQQQQLFWKEVGRVTKQQVSDQPLWLNTAGGGVAWLHVRLDSRPKYYRHQPYAKV